MPRSLVAALAAALAPALVGLAVTAPGASAAAAETTDPGAPSTVVSLAGGGRGLPGPASRALLNSFPFFDGAPDGTVVVQDRIKIMRVNPSNDSVTLIPWPPAVQYSGDVAVDGNDVVMRVTNGIVRVAPDGSTSHVWAGGLAGAIDVGADHVVWALVGNRVFRIPSGGVPTAVTASGAFVEPIDLTVTPDGSKAYVLDVGSTHRGVYQVTAAGLGTRVAGNGGDIGEFRAGLSSTAVTTVDVQSISTNGTTLAMASDDHRLVLSAPVAGGHLSQVAGGDCADRVSHLGTDLVISCVTAPGVASIHRFTAAGTDRGRIIGADPAQPWSPDGVQATDAYLGAVRGSAGTRDGRVVFTTEHGLVREIRSDGTLATRAKLPPFAVGRGKVALATDGTAYVTTGTGALTKVSVDGTVTVVPVDGEVSDVEVLPDGGLAVADSAGHRILQAPAGGAMMTLASAIGTPVDLALDGDRLLVADDGLRRVASDGGVSTVLNGGTPTIVTVTADGPWADVDDWSGQVLVVSPDGSMQPVADLGGVAAQLQAVGDGSVLRAGGDTVSRILTAGLGTPVAPVGVTATPGEGRITFGWDKAFTDGYVVAKRGTSPPRDRWDGVQLPWPTTNSVTVMTIGGEPLVPGEQWSFSFFERGYTTNQGGAATAWGPAVGATAAALPDTTPPGTPADVYISATRTEITMRFTDPPADDLARVVVRYAVGSTPPATAADGLPFPEDFPISGGWQGTLPNPVRGQDYGIAIFAFDHQGNVSRWTGQTRLDFDPPGQVTAVVVQPSYKNIRIQYVEPTDADYSGAVYAIVPAGQDPSVAPRVWAGDSPVLTPPDLLMDTDYTVALWSTDAFGNRADPVVVPFHTLLDSTPPAAPSGLGAVGGDYQVTATWSPPGDTDLKTLTGVLIDSVTGARTESIPLPPNASTYTWTRLPGDRDFTVEVFATDANGLTSMTASAPARTAPDANGPPAPIELSSITVTPASTRSVYISFPRPTLPDLKALGYEVRPLGASPDPIGATYALPTKSATVKGTITLPQAGTAYQLVIHVWDHNGNRTRTIVPSVMGAPNATELPLAPTSLQAISPHDNTLDVSWATHAFSVPVSSWTVTATSGTSTRAVVVDGSRNSAQLGDLIGRTAWTVTVVGTGTWGPGAKSTVSPVDVADSTAPRAVTAAKAIPSYDTDTLTWTNPTDFDLDHIDVVRRGATAAETKLVYRGKGTTVRSTGLVAGRAYTYELRAYDAFGQTWSSFVRLDNRRALASLAGARTLRYGASWRLSGVLRDGSSPLASRKVTLFAQKYGTTSWSTVATVTSTSTGTYAFTVKPSHSTRYRVGYVGSGAIGGAYSAAVGVAVAPTVIMAMSRASVSYGGYVTFSTSVRPGHAGAPAVLQRWNGKSWVTVTSRRLSSTSAASARIKPPARGINKYRWVLPAHTDHSVGVSATASLRVY